MKKVLLFLAKGFETCEAIVFIDVYGLARPYPWAIMPILSGGFRRRNRILYIIFK